MKGRPCTTVLAPPAGTTAAVAMMHAGDGWQHAGARGPLRLANRRHRALWTEKRSDKTCCQ